MEASRVLRDEDVRVIWRTYVALTLAHEAARRWAAAAAPDHRLATIINHQRLALSELDGLLGRAFAEAAEEPVRPDVEVSHAALLM